MAAKIPVKAIYTGADATGLGEFNPGDFIPVANGGTGGTTPAEALAALGIDTALALPSFTASGAITAGKPVAINTNGTVSQVAQSGASTPAPDGVSTMYAQAVTYCFSAFNTTDNMLVTAYRTLTNNYPAVVAATPTATGYTVGTPLVLESVASTTYSPAIARIPGISSYLVVWNTSATNVKFAVVSVDANRVVTLTSAVLSMAISASSTNNTTRVAINDDGTVAVFATGYNSNSSSVGVITLSGTTPTAGGTVVLGTQASTGVMTNVHYDATNVKFIVNYMLGAASAPYPLFSTVVTVTGSTPSINSYNALVPFSNNTLNGSVRLPNGYFAVRSTGYGSSSALTILKNTGAVITAVDTVAWPYLPNYGVLAYDSVRKRIYAFGNINASSLQAAWIDFDETTGKMGSRLSTPVTVTVANHSIGDGWNGCALFDPVTSKFHITFTQTGTSYPASIWFTDVNSNAANFIGIAQNTVADTQTVQVKCVGQTDTNQTGLTTGSRYWVASDGTLTATAGTHYAGRAIAATKLLIGA